MDTEHKFMEDRTTTIPFTRSTTYRHVIGLALSALALTVMILHARPAFCRPLRMDLPHNKLTNADALYLIQIDRDKVWKQTLRTTSSDMQQIQSIYDSPFVSRAVRRPLEHGLQDRKEVALTFDDGPHGPVTLQLLSILVQYHVPATFFMVGEKVEQYPAIVRAIQAAGMTIGNHTFHHVSLTKIPSAYAVAEIKTCGQVIKNATGHSPFLFRPPGGDFNPGVQQIANYLGYTMILWTDDPGDFLRPPPAVIYARVISKLHPGAIILLHDGIPQMVAMVPQLLQYLQSNGYQVITLQQMLKERAEQRAHLAKLPRMHTAPARAA